MEGEEAGASFPSASNDGRGERGGGGIKCPYPTPPASSLPPPPAAVVVVGHTAGELLESTAEI